MKTEEAGFVNGLQLGMEHRIEFHKSLLNINQTKTYSEHKNPTLLNVSP